MWEALLLYYLLLWLIGQILMSYIRCLTTLIYCFITLKLSSVYPQSKRMCITQRNTINQQTHDHALQRNSLILLHNLTQRFINFNINLGYIFIRCQMLFCSYLIWWWFPSLDLQGCAPIGLASLLTARKDECHPSRALLLPPPPPALSPTLGPTNSPGLRACMGLEKAGDKEMANYTTKAMAAYTPCKATIINTNQLASSKAQYTYSYRRKKNQKYN